MSQFKRPKGLNSRSPSPGFSSFHRNSNVVSNRLSHPSGNYMNELQNASVKNQNLMDSLLREGVFDNIESLNPSPTNIAASDNKAQQHTPDYHPDGRYEESFQPGSQKITSSDVRANSEAIIKTADFKKGLNIIKYDNNDFKIPVSQPSPRRKSDIMLPNMNHSFAPSFAVKEQLLNISMKDTIVPEIPKESFYKANLKQVLLVVALKKILKRLQDENSKLKKSGKEHDDREKEFINRIMQLENKLDELQLQEKIWTKNPSDYVKFDLEGLNEKLKSIDQTLRRASADTNQEKFLESVLSKTNEYYVKGEANTESLKRLKDNIGRVKTTLMLTNNLT